MVQEVSCDYLWGISNTLYMPVYYPITLSWFGASIDLLSGCINSSAINTFPPDSGSRIAYSTVPKNVFGTQSPRTGKNYLHLAFATKFGINDSIKEYASNAINLEANKSYCVGFWANLADSSNMHSYGPGIKFFDLNPGNADTYKHFYEPDVWGDFFLTDSVDWKKVRGIYTATGNEQYFAVGNFWPNSNEYNIRYGPGFFPGTAFTYWRSSMFIDDVFITELGNISAGNNKDICLGDSVTLGSAEISGADYTWYPAEGLSNIHAAQPKAAPNTTTTYHLIMDQCRILYDSVTVTVRNPNELAIFPKEISACKGTSVTIAPINTYNNSGSTLSFIPANSFTKTYPDSAIFNAEQNTNILVVQQFNGTCAQVQNNISINASNCKDSPICGSYVNENSILLTPFPTKELTIYSLAGSIIYYASNYNNDYNCTDLSSGIYLLKQSFVDGTERVCKLCWVKR